MFGNPTKRHLLFVTDRGFFSAMYLLINYDPAPQKEMYKPCSEETYFSFLLTN